MIKLKYDPKEDLSYGLFHCPECDSSFYGGGNALHRKGCSQTDYANCEYIIGPKVVQKVKEHAKERGENAGRFIDGLSLKNIKEQLPEVLSE